MTDKQTLLRELPAVDKLLNLPVTVELLADYGRSLTLEALRNTLAETRTAVLHGRQPYTPAPAMLVQTAREWLEMLLTPTLRPVINGTGVIIHTNLGRAPLSKTTLEAIHTIGGSYTTLEYELETGERGSRTVHAGELLTRLTGSEAALVVNNNAAAILLMLTALCQGKEVIISRGQLVEIGGGFRVPDVMAQSGAKLVEVGTTNRTHLHDYETAINENTAAILVAHHSNFKIIGFTGEPVLADLADLAHRHNLLLLYDQGSGALLDTAVYGLDHEPTVLEGLQAGCDMVAFSGDKLLGGPQAGILCGRSELVAKLKKHPLARAVRADKLCLAGLAATLTHYLQENAVKEIPIWYMISRSLRNISDEADTWAARLQEHGIRAEAQNGFSTVGGGSLPGAILPTKLVAITQSNLDELTKQLRKEATPVIGRLQVERYMIDPRTVLQTQVEPLLKSLVKCCAKPTTPAL